MQGAFGAPRHKRRPSINITPLIDVMFLLLIFFMVSSTFKEQLGIDITLPQAGTSESKDVSIHEIVIDKDGAYLFHEAIVSLEQLRAQIAGVLKEEPEATLVLRADAGADIGAFVRAIDVVKDVGGDKLVIPTTLPESGAPTP
jgi:biopolymer transport protein ExbD